MDILTLVDTDDNIMGHEEKESCHRIPVKLHRAFSIFIVNTKGEMLIHRRSSLKNTWPGFWTNACCSHPRKDETLEGATKRRMLEELGFSCPLKYLFKFQYSSNYNEKYGENEIDHVLLGVYDGPVKPDRNEIEDWKFIAVDNLLEDIRSHSEEYTPWFKIALTEVINHGSFT